MKTNYEVPQIEVINIELEDIICLSLNAGLPGVDDDNQ